MINLLILIFVGIIASVIYVFFRNKRKKLETIVTAADARRILISDDYNRHKPNLWLIDTLGIVNPFSINDKSLLIGFKRQVMKTLAAWGDEKKSEELLQTMKRCIKHQLPLLQSDDSQMCLSTFVKKVTLDSFLCAILNVNASEDLLTELPTLIIHLWKNRTDKKAHDRLQKLLQANKNAFSQSEFWQKIQTILSQHSNIISQTVINDFEEKISNPLNIIVPGWETMWRLVFHSLLELLRRPELLKELRSQLQNPSQSYRECRLLRCILKETLRLYPPTRHIYRTNLKTDQDVCIDVQQIHRDKNIWGSNALEFQPERFRSELTMEQTESYLPFSISCPARHNFAYNFAGAIVVQILHQCPTFTVAQGCALPSTDELLEPVRDSYNDLRVIV